MSELLRNIIFVTAIEIKVIKTNNLFYNLYLWSKEKRYIVFMKKCTKRGFIAIIFFVSNKVNGYCYHQFASHYYILMFKFVACPAGFGGLNCSTKCNASSYGLGCAESCDCEPCHHVFGCNLTVDARGKDEQN